MSERDLIAEISDRILKSRPICRPYKGKFMRGIYLEIYNRLELKIREELNEIIKRQGSITEENIKDIKKTVFINILNDDDLKEMAITAKKSQPNSPFHQYTLNELVKAIELSKKSKYYPHRGIFQGDFYKEIYEEALAETLIYITTNIDKYDPERGRGKFINWFYCILEYQMMSCRRQVEEAYKDVFSDLDLENIPVESREFFLSDLLYKYIDEDDNKIFSKSFCKNNYKASFRHIALSRFNGKSWQEISLELNIKRSTLSGFYRQKCQQFIPLFRKELDI